MIGGNTEQPERRYRTIRAVVIVNSNGQYGVAGGDEMSLDEAVGFAAESMPNTEMPEAFYVLKVVLPEPWGVGGGELRPEIVEVLRR